MSAFILGHAHTSAQILKDHTNVHVRKIIRMLMATVYLKVSICIFQQSKLLLPISICNVLIYV